MVIIIQNTLFIPKLSIILVFSIVHSGKKPKNCKSQLAYLVKEDDFLRIFGIKNLEKSTKNLKKFVLSFPFIVFYDSKKHEMVFWMNNEIYEKETKIIKHFAPYVTKKVLRRNKGLKKNEQENSNNQVVINDVKKKGRV